MAGIANMIFCKSKYLKKLQKPIDAGSNIFGNNKTYKGFLGYIIFNILFQVILGIIIPNNLIYKYLDNNVLNNIFLGFTFGVVYAIFELPNSFIKRRLNIAPGKQAIGYKKYIFIILDQIDSVIGLRYNFKNHIKFKYIRNNILYNVWRNNTYINKHYIV